MTVILLYLCIGMLALIILVASQLSEVAYGIEILFPMTVLVLFWPIVLVVYTSMIVWELVTRSRGP